MAETDDRALLRKFIARELETINEYERFATLASSPEIKRFFEHVADEEREHVAEGMHELTRLDPRQRTSVDYHEAHGLEPTRASPAAAVVPAAPEPEPPPPPAAGDHRAGLLRGYLRLTVGNLRGMPESER